MKLDRKWQRIRYMPSTGLYKPDRRVTASPEHIAIALEAAEEGQVLLKNEGGLLPFAAGQRLAVFGKAQVDYVKGGGGSGDVGTPYARSILEGLEMEASEEQVFLFDPLSRFYRADVAEQRAKGAEPGRTKEPAIPEALLKEARLFTDTAVITICRFSGEGYDRTGEADDGDFYLSLEEQKMVQDVRACFPKICVVLNTGGMMDTAWFRRDPGIQAALLAWQGGMEGGLASARILTGKVCPSGHLTDTFAENFQAYPSSAHFNDSQAYVEYEEDIFVGYRYFETVPGASEKVCYPFGFGLSYTTFDLACGPLTETNGRFVLQLTVKNTGTCSGKDVVQVYVAPPTGKLQRPARILTAFAKTRELQPGAQESLTLTFEQRDFAAYDDEGLICRNAWVLEHGEYTVYAGEHVRCADVAGTWTLDEDCVLEVLASRCAPKNLRRRMQADGSMQELKYSEEAVLPQDRTEGLPFDGQQPKDCTWIGEKAVWSRELSPSIREVAEGRISLDTLLDAMSLEQQIHLLGGQPNRGCANTYGFGNLPQFAVPNVMTCDGPAGVRLKPECGVQTTAFPCATLLACSWNESLLWRVGRAAAEEVRENNFGVWLAPAMNIHRSPLCGRNFEYYSEDPLVSGRCAASMVRGIQSMGVAATIKHFACNNKETNRRQSDSRVSERALREIYLRGFEICVKEAQPWALMTSYNIINGERASCNRDLLEHILRGEWGYEGVVTTDWYTRGEQWREVLAGNDIKMGCGMPEHTLRCVQDGTLTPEAVRACARRVLEMILKLA